jgi:transcriptional regulator with XRE-family HTH domain
MANIGDRIRTLREERKLSQGDIEKRTGLLRCYISRVENGHTIPALETLVKLARALELPLYRLFYEGETPPKIPKSLKWDSQSDVLWGSSGRDKRFLSILRHCLSRIDERDRQILMSSAQKMASYGKR